MPIVFQDQVLRSQVLINSNSGLTGTGIPCMTSVMEQLRTAFDWDEAEKSGRIMPNRGVNEEFDAANAKIEEVEAKFENYLQTVRQTLGCSSEVQLVLERTHDSNQRQFIFWFVLCSRN